MKVIYNSDDVAFKVYDIFKDTINEIDEIYYGDLQELSFEINFIEKNNLSIVFKNEEKYYKYSNYVKKNWCLIFESTIDGLEQYLFFATAFNEEYQSNEFQLTLKLIDWKGYVEERREIIHNVDGAQPDDPNFNSLDYQYGGLIKSIKQMFQDFYYRNLIQGLNRSKGTTVSNIPDRQILVMNELGMDFGENDPCNFLTKKKTMAEFRKDYINSQIGYGIDYVQYSNLPKVFCYFSQLKNKIQVFYQKQKIYLIENESELIESISLDFDNEPILQNGFVESSEKDFVSYVINFQKHDKALLTTDAPVEENKYDGQIDTLQNKAFQQLKQSNFKRNVSIKANTNLKYFEKVNPGDVILLRGFNENIDGFYDVYQINLDINFENNFMDYSFGEIKRRENIFSLDEESIKYYQEIGVLLDPR